jgi:hypothetical protein
MSRHLLLERLAQRTADDGERDRDRDGAVVLDEHVAHHVEIRDRPLELGIDHLLERLQNGVAIGSHAASVAERGGTKHVPNDTMCRGFLSRSRSLR